MAVGPVWDQETVGSNPAARTRKEPTFVYDKCGFFSTKSTRSDGWISLKYAAIFEADRPGSRSLQIVLWY